MDRRGRSYKESLAEDEVKRLEKDASTLIGALLKSAGAQQKAPEPEPPKKEPVVEEVVPVLLTPPPTAKLTYVKPGTSFPIWSNLFTYAVSDQSCSSSFQLPISPPRGRRRLLHRVLSRPCISLPLPLL